MNILNKIPKVLEEKTELAPKVWIILAVGIIAIVLLTIFPKKSVVSLQVNNQSFQLQVANTSSEQQTGLSYRKSLPKNQGMLFVFASSQVECFWMKGMEFPLDIIWLNSTKQVVRIAADVSPATYPHSFCPLTPAQYVIELNAGEVADTDIRLTQTLRF